MIEALELQKMSLSDKFMTIEQIWDDISHTASAFASPDWHKKILQERDKNIESGEDKLMDWGIAKEQLRNTCK